MADDLAHFFVLDLVAESVNFLSVRIDLSKKLKIFTSLGCLYLHFVDRELDGLNFMQFVVVVDTQHTERIFIDALFLLAEIAALLFRVLEI